MPTIQTARRLTVTEAIEPFREWSVTINRAPKTIQNHLSAINAWSEAMKVGGFHPDSIATKHVEKWIHDSDSNPRTKQMDLAALRSFFSFLTARGWAGSDPTAGVTVSFDQLNDYRPRKIKPFTPTEIRSLIADCESRGDQFWQFAIMIGSETGLRLWELCQLEWSCFDHERVVTVWSNKQNKHVTYPITKQLAGLVTEIPVEDAKYLFPLQRKTILDPKKRPALSMQFKRLCDRLRIKGKTFDVLRLLRS